MKGENHQGRILIPAVSGPLMLSVPLLQTNTIGFNPVDDQASLCLVGDAKSLAKNVPVEEVSYDDSSFGKKELSVDKRIIFIAEANTIIQLPAAADELKCIAFDANAALVNSKVHHLFVSSRPIDQVAAGEYFNYQIDVRSNSKKIKFTLESGPAGMSVSPSGKLSWKTTTESPSKNEIVIAIATDDGQEVFHTFKVTVVGATETASERPARGTSVDAPTAPKVDVSQFDGEEKVVKLPGLAREMVAGGAGRYILIHLPDLSKIAILDVSIGKITGYIPVEGDRTQFAASKDHLLTFNVSNGRITRWNLATQEKEATQESLFPGAIRSAATGCATNGPVLVSWSSDSRGDRNCSFLDSGNLTEISTTWSEDAQGFAKRSFSAGRFEPRIRAASFGRFFTIDGFGSLRIDGTKVTPSFRRDAIRIPSADGNFYAENGMITTFENASLSQRASLSELSNNQMSGGIMHYIPAVTTNYYLAFSRQYGSIRQIDHAKLFVFGEKRPLLTVPDLKLELPEDTVFGQAMMDPADRVFFVPDAKVVVTAAATNDSLTLHRFDVDKSLAKSGIDYLFVTSRPQSTIKLGETLDYAVQAKSKRGGLKFKLESGPQGMVISPEGKVTWNVPNDLAESAINAIVVVTDSSGQEFFHNFSLEIPEARDLVSKQEYERMRKLQLERWIQKIVPLKEKRSRMLAERKRLSTSETTPPSPVKEVFPIRTWKDSSGSRSIQAAFVKVIDKKTVVLTDANGLERMTPLERLSVEDIYYAVECDIKLRNPTGRGMIEDVSSPVKDVPMDRVAPQNVKNIDRQLVEEIEARITELINVIESEEPSTFLTKVFHPDSLGQGQKQLAKIDKFKILEALLRLDTETTRAETDSVVTIHTNADNAEFSQDGSKLRKHEGKWYLTFH